VALLATLCLLLPSTGCIKLSSRRPPRHSPVPTVTQPRSEPAAPAPAKTPDEPLEAQAYPLFNALRNDILDKTPSLEQTNCAFVIGVDVSKSSYDSQVMEYTTRILADAGNFFFAPGDRVVVVPWDAKIREDHVEEFGFTGPRDGAGGLNAAFESILKLVRPENRGSNLLDARGYCMERAQKLQEQAGAGLRGVVLVFTDIRVPDGKLGRRYTQEQLASLRRQFTGDTTTDFDARLYNVERTRIWCHVLVGKAPEGADTGKTFDRRRSTVTTGPQVADAAPPKAPLPVKASPRPKKDTSGTRVLLMLLSLAALVALIGLPFTWQHHLAIGGSQERIRAIGGRVVIRAAEGIAPPGEYYLRVPDIESRPLIALEGKGPNVVARAARGVRLNDGRTLLAIPAGKPVTLRASIEGVAGEQAIELQVSDFWTANTGQIIAMGIALLVMLASIIG